jgi:signal transduction histidine kinase
VPLTAAANDVGLLILHDVEGPRAWSLQAPLVEGLARDIAAALAQAFAYQRLQELDREKATFVSSVSHELRTPLTSIIGYVEMLADGDAGPLQPEQRQLLDVVERSTVRLLTLIEDLLTLSRIESGSFVSSLAEVDLAAVLDGAREALEPVLAGRDIRLELTVDHGLPPLWADAGQLERVVFNLVSNAAKFSPDGAAVSVQAYRDGDDVALAVVDRGIGIPLEEQDKLFTRFFRSSTSTSMAIQGTGLGLAIVRTIVEQHQGAVSVDSVPNAGTTVRVVLPSAVRRPMGVA